MKINFKEYLTNTLKTRRNEIIEYEDMLEYMGRIGNCNVKAESIREVMNYKQSLICAWEIILEEL